MAEEKLLMVSMAVNETVNAPTRLGAGEARIRCVPLDPSARRLA